jgi:TolA-binding protein
MLSAGIDSKSHRDEGKPRFIDRLTAFLHKYRIVLLVLLIALVVFLVGYFGWTEWNKRSRERSASLAERAQELYAQWQGASEGEGKASSEQELNRIIELVISKYPRRYAAQRAFFIQANVAYEKEEWQQAAESYTALADSFPKSYLSPLSLYNAGVSYEQLDDIESAVTSYRRIVEEHKQSFLVPHALFSLGRLHELNEAFEEAFEVYNQLEDDYPLSNWTKAGRNRIIDLKVQGKIAQ